MAMTRPDNPPAATGCPAPAAVPAEADSQAGPSTAGDAFFSPNRARLAGLAGRFAGTAGWVRHAIAFFAGGIATLALPPVYAVPALWLSFPPFLWLLDGAASRGQAFRLGWSFGFGFFFFGLYWISFALFTDLARFWWLVPFALTLLPAALAVLIGCGAVLTRLWPGQGVDRVLVFGIVWTALEWFRGHAFSGFPWNLIGYVWTDTLPVAQAASLIGVYGLSLLTVTIAALPAAFGWRQERPKRAALSCAVGLLLLAGLAVWGQQRLATAASDPVPNVVLRLVQPGILQKDKWDPLLRQENFLKHLRLSIRPLPAGVAPGPGPTDDRMLVIWPEAAVTYFIERDPVRLAAVARATPPGGWTLTGTPRLTLDADGTRQFWNSLVAIDSDANVAAAYDKAHLVPFGEYVPLRQWLPDWLPLATIAAGTSDFSAGPGVRTLELPGVPRFGPLICYEIIFPAAVTGPDPRPRWFLNITNDAWYGETAGPHQHFAKARMRAVEEGIPVVRVANTGISGVVDAFGRVPYRLGLGETGILDARLPTALAATTPYGRYGDLLALVFAIGLGLTAWTLRRASERLRDT